MKNSPEFLNLRPIWVEYPNDPKTAQIEDQFLIGKDLLVKPVTAADQHRTKVFLPSEDVCFAFC